MISDQLNVIQSRIDAVCKRLGKNPKDITLVGITKYADAVQIQEALDAGLVHIGENRVQDAQKKFGELRSSNNRKHLVGHLQTNKAKLAVELFDMIESVDSFKLADALEREAAKMDRKVDVLVQVNTSGEEQKFGIAKEEAMDLIKEVENLSHLNLQGLMTIAPFTADAEIIRQTFQELKVIFDQANGTLDLHMPYLSMGMSGDFEIALEEGANMVRIGRSIFQET